MTSITLTNQNHSDTNIIPSRDLEPANTIAAHRNTHATSAAGDPFQSDGLTDDITTYLVRLMITLATQQRANATDNRFATRAAAQAELLQQADFLRNAAQKMETSAIISVALNIVCTAATVAGGIASLRSSLNDLVFKQEIKPLETALATERTNLDKIRRNVAGSEKDLTRIASAQNLHEEQSAALNARTELFGAQYNVTQQSAQLAQRSGELCARLSGGADGFQQAQVERDRARAVEHETKGMFHQQSNEIQREIQGAADERIRDLIALIRTMQDSKVESLRAIARF